MSYKIPQSLSNHILDHKISTDDDEALFLNCEKQCRKFLIVGVRVLCDVIVAGPTVFRQENENASRMNWDVVRGAMSKQSLAGEWGWMMVKRFSFKSATYCFEIVVFNKKKLLIVSDGSCFNLCNMIKALWLVSTSFIF